VVGSVRRSSGQCRLRVCKCTDGQTLRSHVQWTTSVVQWTTSVQAVCNTDEWRGYSRLERVHQQVAHSQGEWARDEDGDGVREVHTNTIEGLWTTLRNFLRPFRGVQRCA
jgi:transposase